MLMIVMFVFFAMLSTIFLGAAQGQWADEGKSFESDAAIAQYLRVKHSSAGVVTTAGIEECFGVIQDAALAAADRVYVLPINKSGTIPMVAAGAITAGADVYPAASGKISATRAGTRIGYALAAASGDGSIIEVLPCKRERKTISRQVLAADVSNYLAVMPRAGRVTAIRYIPQVVGSNGGTVSCDVRKILAASASLAGAAAGANVIELLSASLDLKSTVTVKVDGTLTATDASLVFAAGDKLGLLLTGTLTAVVGLLEVDYELE